MLPFECEPTNIQIQGDHVPLESIHVLYSKLHVEEHEAIEEETETQLDLNDECEELKRYLNTLDIFGQRTMNKNVCELTYPCITSMC